MFNVCDVLKRHGINATRFTGGRYGGKVHYMACPKCNRTFSDNMNLCALSGGGKRVSIRFPETEVTALYDSCKLCGTKYYVVLDEKRNERYYILRSDVSDMPIRRVKNGN